MKTLNSNRPLRGLSTRGHPAGALAASIKVLCGREAREALEGALLCYNFPNRE
jgi:hypothetical protein